MAVENDSNKKKKLTFENFVPLGKNKYKKGLPHNKI